MNIKAEKLELIKWISQLDDSQFIDKLKKIRYEYLVSKDWWDEISDKEKESISKGREDIKNGRVHTHESVKKAIVNNLGFD